MDPERTQGPDAEPSAETDADLLAYMAMAGDDPDAAKAAWEVFYRRHVEYLYGACLRAYGALLGGAAGAADLTADTFRRAYENAGRFDPAGIADPERLRLRARAWLGWIARRLVQDILRGRGRLPTQSLELNRWQQIAGSQRPRPTPSVREQAVRQAIGSLNEREQLVIRTTFQWYRPDKRHQRLPNEVAAELARTLGTTPENLRQLRRRALRKIAEFVRGQAGPEMKETTDAQETPRQAPRRQRR